MRVSNNAFYVYGVIRFGFNSNWKEIGVDRKSAYMISIWDFNALVHNCKEKPYTAEDPEKIKELILAHNKVLDRAMEDFGGVIPLPFNTIIKKGKNSAKHNLKKWLNDDKKRLEKIWNKIKGKKEYGLRIYYEKDKLTQEASMNEEVKKIEENLEGKSKGLSYLLEGKIKSKTKEIIQNRINQFKQNIYNNIKEVTEDTKINASRISINEEKDLLLSLSILVKEEQIDEIKRILERTNRDFSFQVVGPFAPYSFVEDERI